MEYIICFICAILTLCVGVFFTYSLLKKNKVTQIQPFNYLIASVFLSGICVFVPIYLDLFKEDSLAWVKTVLLSIHNAIRLFIVDGDFNIIHENITAENVLVSTPYTILAAILFVIAPILTFTVILSLIKNIYAYGAFLIAFNRDIYVFSELNEESIALANSLKSNNKTSKIVYADVYRENNENSNVLIQKSKKLKSILFQNSIEYIDYRFHSKRRKMVFFLIGKDELENIREARMLIETYKDRADVELYVFSKNYEGELILTDVDSGKLKVRRINAEQKFIDHYLYEEGTNIFDRAKTIDAKHKQIRIAIVGIKEFGYYMFKSLIWFCQMIGYEVYINIYEEDVKYIEKLYSECPELFDGKINSNPMQGKEKYNIKITKCISFENKDFYQSMVRFEPTFTFVSLENDSENIHISVNLRSLFEQNHLYPQIVSICSDAYINDGLCDIHNFSGQSYKIDFIGSTAEVYSIKSISDSKLEDEALARHLKWGEEDAFWKYEYNYKSSIALTIHSKMKKHCGVPGVDKKESELTENERNILEKLEHRRWNAYMRSEGFVYSGSRDSKTRNNLGKMHNNLLPYDLLSEEDKRKDSVLSTK